MPEPKSKPNPPKAPKHPVLDPADRARLRAFNTSENSEKAVNLVSNNLEYLTDPTLAFKTAPKGEKELKATFYIKNQPALSININPTDGAILPKGLHGHDDLDENESQQAIDLATKTLADLQKSSAPTSPFTVLPAAEFREPHSCWAVPIAHRGRIIGHIKVSADGSRLLDA